MKLFLRICSIPYSIALLTRVLQWIEPSRSIHPTIFYTKIMVKRLSEDRPGRRSFQIRKTNVMRRLNVYLQWSCLPICTVILGAKTYFCTAAGERARAPFCPTCFGLSSRVCLPFRCFLWPPSHSLHSPKLAPQTMRERVFPKYVTTAPRGRCDHARKL